MARSSSQQYGWGEVTHADQTATTRNVVADLWGCLVKSTVTVVWVGVRTNMSEGDEVDGMQKRKNIRGVGGWYNIPVTRYVSTYLVPGMFFFQVFAKSISCERDRRLNGDNPYCKLSVRGAWYTHENISSTSAVSPTVQPDECVN